MLEPKLEWPNFDKVAAFQQHRLDAGTVHERAVDAVEVAQVKARRCLHEQAVHWIDAIDIEPNIAIGASADEGRRRSKRSPSAGLTAILHDEFARSRS